jgi:hypothetical protein
MRRPTSSRSTSPSIYYSVSTITSTGFGDIFPRLTAPKLVSSSELLLALFYHVGIFTIGLKHFQEHVEAVDAGATSESQSSMVLAAARTKMRELRTKYPRLDAIRKWFIASVFPVSAIIQAVFLIILHISDPDMFNRPSGTSTNAGLIFIFFIAQVRHSRGDTARGFAEVKHRTHSRLFLLSIPGGSSSSETFRSSPAPASTPSRIELVAVPVSTPAAPPPRPFSPCARCGKPPSRRSPWPERGRRSQV